MGVSGRLISPYIRVRYDEQLRRHGRGKGFLYPDSVVLMLRICS